MSTPANADVYAWQWYPDSANVNSPGTALESVNTSHEFAQGDLDSPFFLYFGVENDGDMTFTAGAQLQYEDPNNPGTWNDVNATSSYVRIAAGAATDADLITGSQVGAGAGSFSNGEYDEGDGATSTNVGGGSYTNYAYAIQFRSADITGGESINFRLVETGTTTVLTNDSGATANATFPTFSSPTNINAGLATLSISELGADVDLNVDIDGALDTFSISELQAGVSLSKTIDAALATLSIAELGAAVSLDIDIDASLVTLTLSELAAAASLGRNISAAVDVLAISELAADVDLNVDVDASLATIGLTELAAGIALGKNVDALAAALGVTVLAADVDLNVDVQAAAGAIALTELVATVDLAAGTDIAAGVAALSITELTATVELAGAGGGLGPEYQQPCRVRITVGVGI